MLERWREFRRTQRAALRASNQSHRRSGRGRGVRPRPARARTTLRWSGATAGLLNGVLPPTEGRDAPSRAGAGRGRGRRADATAWPVGPSTASRRSTWASSGRSACSPRCCCGTPSAGSTTVITLLVVAFFLTLALNPLVESLTRAGRVKRPARWRSSSPACVVVFTLLGLLVVPPVIQQGAELAQEAPDYARQLLRSRFVRQTSTSTTASSTRSRRSSRSGSPTAASSARCSAACSASGRGHR